jgi:hypothetical protein
MTGGSNHAWLQLYLSVPCEAVCERKSKLQAVTAFTQPTATEKRSKICMVKLWYPVRLDEGFEWSVNLLDEGIEWSANLLDEGIEWSANLLDEGSEWSVNLLNEGNEWSSNILDEGTEWSANLLD